MNNSQVIIMAVLVAAMGLFLWGRWRHDLVAMAALLACVLAGVVPANDAFSGFGHPAVITVACVLVIGYGLQISGAVEGLTKRLLPTSAGPTLSIMALIGLAAVLSGFMNNVGALALLMPVAIQIAGKQNLAPGKVLMPLAFGSILGGMTTLIGTPPNLIVSGYRETMGEGGFAMFDFAPVGVSVAVVGVLFVGLIGWRLVPVRKGAQTGKFDSGVYLSEVRIVEGGKLADKRVTEADLMLEKVDAQMVAMIRRDVRISAPNPRRVLRVGDLLEIEVDPESLSSVLTELGLKLEEEVPAEDKSEAVEKPPNEEVELRELVVTPNAALVNRSATDMDLRFRYGINLLAISRNGRRTVRRLRSIRLQAGDVLLVQGVPEALSGFASLFGCLPLAARDIRVPKKGQALKAALVMAAVVAATATAFGVLPAAISFAAGALAFIVLGIIPVRSIYSSVDWSVIVLLAAMLPVAGAMAATGAADTIAGFMLDQLAQGHAVGALVVVLIVTMFLSDLMNNAATAAVMCPIAISTASQLGVHTDAFLMAVAVGASCAFLTPIGHQNNTLILGPGGFRFGDYWKLGLLVEAIVVVVGVPVLLWAWPL